MLRSSLLFLLFFLIAITSHSQVLRGIIVDSRGTPIPYSTVYIRELSLGSATNSEGRFELKLSAGSYVCVFQSMGYQTVVKEIDLKKGSPALTIILPDMIYDLSSVEIKGSKEDPAYNVMRQVIANAPLFANIIKHYKADVYIKGSLTITGISKLVKWIAKDDLKEYNIKAGDTYLEESVNEISFTGPDKVTQRVKSIQSNFPDFGENSSNSAMGFISGNIYQPRGFGSAISPLRAGAFNHYRFKHEGRTLYGDYAIHKITVIPKGKGSQYIQGTIYVVDGLWCLSNLNVFKDEQMGVKLQLSQNYNEVKEGVWLPVSNRLKVEMDLLGNSGSFDYHTSIQYRELVVNTTKLKSKAQSKIQDKVNDIGLITKTDISDRQKVYHKKIDDKIASKQRVIDKLSQKEELSTAESYRLARLQQQQQELRIKDSLRFNHEYVESYRTTIDSNARKLDSSYWNAIRPIPLSGDELSSLRASDTIKPEKSKSDSVNSAGFKWLGKIFIGGYFINDTTTELRNRGLINPVNISFNLVDGLRYQNSISFIRRLPNAQSLSFYPMLGYAFGRNALYGDMPLLWKSEQLNMQAGIRLGNQAVDYNPDGIHPLESSIEALVFRENPAKFYKSSYLDLKYSMEPVHGLVSVFQVSFSNNKTLGNVTDYSVFYRKSKQYEPNIPDNPLFAMVDHQDLSMQIALRYKPAPFYYIKDGVKKTYRRFNDYPEYSLIWKKGIPTGTFDTDYDLIKAVVYQQKRLGVSNKLNYRAEAGYFVNSRAMWFPQFQHFAKRPLIAGIKEFFPYFLLLNSYEFSTNDFFAAGHLQYKSPFIILKRLPILRNRLWDESFFFSYLYSPQHKNYFEPGYGIGGIIFNLGVFAGFQGLEYQQVGVRLSITIFTTNEVSF